MTRLEILGMPVDRMSPAEFVHSFIAKAHEQESGYACVSNVHQCILFYDEPDFRDVIRGATFVMPDSSILQKFISNKYKLASTEVLRGDQLTVALCEKAAQVGLSIALIGGKNNEVLASVAAALEGQVTTLKIVHTWSPPFRELTSEEEKDMLTDIRESGADIVFIGLGCPKQERWMARYSNDLPQMMIGVGAAFDFISGEVKPSASWVHGSGLEWAHRLISEPRRLWRRYLTTSPRFIGLYLVEEFWPRLISRPSK